MPCDSSDINVSVPDDSFAPSIDGFGRPFAPSLPDFNSPLATGFPEDLIELMDLLQFIVPGTIIKPMPNPNFQKDVYDGIMDLLNKFFPFLMVYKFFLPILELIICIIEVLCALMNPIKLIIKLKKLFRTCIPAVLSLFPIFAMILMILSLLLLILALIEHIIERILQLIDLLLSNIIGLVRAFEMADEVGVLAIVQKLSEILCSFQNLFVLFTIFKTIIDIIKNILKLFFSIPPCDDGDESEDRCCTPDVCPDFIRNNEEISFGTGTLQYFNRAAREFDLGIPGIPTGLINSNLRDESWQFFDSSSGQNKAFYNITHAYDLPPGINTVFFPTDGTYSATTPVDQAPYTVDLKLFYVPASFNRIDNLGKRYVQIKNCIVLSAPTQNYKNYQGTNEYIENGVLLIQGGLAYENNGTTPILINNVQATLNTLIHQEPHLSSIQNPILSPDDGYRFVNFEYTFKIHHEILLGKNLITLGCVPSVGLDRTFTNTVFGGNAGANFTLINNIVNSNTFPDPGAAQQCLLDAVNKLKGNISAEGVAQFQADSMSCLDKLKDNTNSTINELISLAFDPYKSNFTLDPSVQFTTRSINVQVALNETSGQSITSGLPAPLALDVAKKIKPIITFGNISNFTYDGSRFFNAKLTSKIAGNGTIKMSFEDKIFSTVILPTNVDIPPSIEEIILPYSFVYSPISANPKTPDGDIDGQPDFNETDTSQIES